MSGATWLRLPVSLSLSLDGSETEWTETSMQTVQTGFTLLLHAAPFLSGLNKSQG
jgi:hypothetical protein